MRRPGTAMALGLAAERRCTRGFWRLVLPEFRAMHSAARDEGVVRTSLEDFASDDLRALRHDEAHAIRDALARQLDAQILGPLVEDSHPFALLVPDSPWITRHTS